MSSSSDAEIPGSKVGNAVKRSGGDFPLVVVADLNEVPAGYTRPVVLSRHSSSFEPKFDPFSFEQALRAAWLPSSRAYEDSAWHGHVSFAHWVVAAVKPNVIVELGTQRGVSYTAFCRAVKELRIHSRCFAIDTWQGDHQTGGYSNEIYENLNAFNAEHFSSFSTLLRGYFDDHRDSFADGSIDLLHIDGLHTYDAVRHDFESWLPKMSSRGVVLFHDAAVHKSGFGVWKLWADLTSHYPGFLFEHWAGLGVLAVGPHACAEVTALCKIYSDVERTRIQTLFEQLSSLARAAGIREFDHIKYRNEVKTAAMSQASAAMRGWALAQLAPWLETHIETFTMWAEFDRLNLEEPNVFIYTLSNGKVVLHDKPGSTHEGNLSPAQDRALCYQQFFEVVTRTLPQSFETRLAVYIGDGALDSPRVPVFSFQKTFENNSVLLPDPDMIGRGFPTAHDTLAFKEKRCHAIFVGSTTGGVAITTEALRRDGAIDRIRAATHFRGDGDVSVMLPILVQYDSEETASVLREMGFGSGQEISWDEQLKNKFIISIDGNGATCTRVSITLSSQSVLLKYDSPSQLYYFSGMIPWVHYIPIRSHSDVSKVISAERQSPGLFSDIVKGANQFAQSYLTSDAIRCYTATLLSLYAEQIAKPTGQANIPELIEFRDPPVAEPPSQELPTDFDSSVYLELNPDVAAAGADPARHYIRHGRAEGRRWKI
jgi:hypothetical protein